MKLTLARRILISSLKANNKVVNPTTEKTAAAQNATVAAAAAAAVSQNGERFLRKIDLSKDIDKLSPDQKIYIQKLVEKNTERFTIQQRLRRHYNVTGLILTSFVLSIYAYTLYSIKQEKFLDDFDVPEPPDPAVKSFKKE